jgi:LysM repeat protein
VQDAGILPTATLVVTASPTPSATVCAPPPDWETYVVRRGDTLFQIALATGSGIADLRAANCLEDIDNIYAGLALSVPQLPEGVVGGNLSTPLPDFETGAVARGCTAPGVAITSPFPGAGVTGVVIISGSASITNFDYYKIEVRPDYSSIYNFYGRYEAPVTSGVLARLNTDLFDNGLHWIRLTAVDNTGNFPLPCDIPVIFR